MPSSEQPTENKQTNSAASLKVPCLIRLYQVWGLFYFYFTLFDLYIYFSLFLPYRFFEYILWLPVCVFVEFLSVQMSETLSLFVSCAFRGEGGGLFFFCLFLF